MIHEGSSFPVIAKRLNISLKTVYNWLKAFMVRCFTWLWMQHYQGRGCKSKLTSAQKKELYDIVVAGPEAASFDCGIWNTAMIALVIEKKFKVTYNPRYLATLLKKMGLSYQKSKFISDKVDDDDWLKTREDWDNRKWPAILEKAKKLKAVILFGDEVSFAQWGSLGRTWPPRPTACGKNVRKTQIFENLKQIA